MFNKYWRWRDHQPKIEIKAEQGGRIGSYDKHGHFTGMKHQTLRMSDATVIQAKLMLIISPSTINTSVRSQLALLQTLESHFFFVQLGPKLLNNMEHLFFNNTTHRKLLVRLKVAWNCNEFTCLGCLFVFSVRKY